MRQSASFNDIDRESEMKVCSAQGMRRRRGYRNAAGILYDDFTTMVVRESVLVPRAWRSVRHIRANVTIGAQSGIASPTKLLGVAGSVVTLVMGNGDVAGHMKETVSWKRCKAASSV